MTTASSALAPSPHSPEAGASRRLFVTAKGSLGAPCSPCYERSCASVLSRPISWLSDQEMGHPHKQFPGRVVVTQRYPRGTAVAERIQHRFMVMPSGCREWTEGTDRHGYGYVKVDGKTVPTHRLVWELANGPIPPGLNVLHHCDNPPCCQTEPTVGYPEGHLFLGTIADNNADMRAKGRARTNGNELRACCSRGHSYTEANTRWYRGKRVCRECARVMQQLRRAA